GNIVPRTFKTGTPYSLSSYLSRENNSFTFNPTLQLGSPSLLGNIRLDYSSGMSTYRFPEQFEDISIQEGLTDIELQALETKLAQATATVVSAPGFAAIAKELAGKNFTEQITQVNAAGDPSLADALGIAYNQVIQDFENTRKNLKKLADPAVSAAIDNSFSQAEATAGTVPTADPQSDQAVIESLNSEEGAKKHISILFNSSTSEDTTVKGTTEHDDFHRRANKFLDTIDRLSDRGNIKVALVTINNQQELGLDGLIPPVVPGSQTSSTDVNEGIIRLVFIRSTPAGDFFIDHHGNNIGPVGSRVEFSRLVYTTMPSTSLSWRNGQLRYISTGKRAATPEKAKTYQDAYRTTRTKMLSRTKGYEVFPFTVSRGFPSYDKSGTPYAVTSALVDPKTLAHPIVVIPTLGTGEVQGRAVGSIIHNEETLALPLGRPVLQYGATFAPLNNRRLTSREKTVIKKLLIKMADGLSKGKVDRAILNYLQGLVYWAKPAKGKTVTKGQVWYQSGYLYLGSEKNRLPFLADLVETSQALETFLDQVYVSANNFLLTQRFNDPFNEIVDIDDSGTITQLQWKNYQYFLLSPTIRATVDDNTGLDGTARSAEDIPFTTDIAPVGQTNDPYASTFQQRYITLHNLDLFPHTKAQPASGDVISDDIYNRFVDKNEVPSTVLKSIAEKVVGRNALSTREQAILTAKTAEINKIIASMAAAQPTPPPGEQGQSQEVDNSAPPPTTAGRFVLDGVTMNL
ncbi:MAG TPA: hypothetical protein VJ720_05340, partial [Chitinophaga sp.]|nr:hypothetical protein [Chitinophaga sp.]